MENMGDSICMTNIAELSGEILTAPIYSHKTYGEAFYETILGIDRRSSYRDEIRILLSERLIWDKQLAEGTGIRVFGQVRTYNSEMEGKSRLNIIVFAKEFEICPQDYRVTHDNYVYLEGFICKEPIRRSSPLGREICDLMLAVNRKYNKSDYIPCIAWGRNAVYAGSLEVGKKLSVTGRIQSREYRKKDQEGNSIAKTAYEVSILKIEE